MALSRRKLHDQLGFEGYWLSILSRGFKLPVPDGYNRMTTEIWVAGLYDADVVRLSIQTDCEGHNGESGIARVPLRHRPMGSITADELGWRVVVFSRRCRPAQECSGVPSSQNFVNLRQYRQARAKENTHSRTSCEVSHHLTRSGPNYSAIKGSTVRSGFGASRKGRGAASGSVGGDGAEAPGFK